MNPTRIRQILGGFSILGGLVWIALGVNPVISVSSSWWHRTPAVVSGVDLIGAVGAVLLALLFLIPGYCAVLHGFRLFQEMRISSTRWVVGLLSTGAAFLAGAALSKLPLDFPTIFPQRIQSMAFLLGISFLALVFYMVSLRVLFPRLGAPQPKLSSLISRGALVVLAWELWFVLNAVTDEYFGRPKATEPHYLLWELLTFMAPIAIAYGAFRLAASRLSSPMPEAFAAEPPWKTNRP